MPHYVIHRDRHCIIRQEVISTSIGQYSNSHKSGIPYLSQHDRKHLEDLLEKKTGKKGTMEMETILHVDFDEAEISALYCLLSETKTVHTQKNPDLSIQDLFIQAARLFCPQDSQVKKLVLRISKMKALYEQFQSTVPTMTFDDFDVFPHLLGCAKLLGSRRGKAIQAFIKDAEDGCLPTTPTILRVLPLSSLGGSGTFTRYGCSNYSFSNLLRLRELGTCNSRFRQIPRTDSLTKFESWKTWKGASNDINCVAWSPDGTRFAIGATAQTDVHDMQYNRNKNLVIGDLVTSRLKELPKHHIPRPISFTENAVPPFLFTSISSIKWTENLLYTASYDHTVKIWSSENHEQTNHVFTLEHPGKVEVMDISSTGREVATGCSCSSSFALWPDQGFDEKITLLTKDNQRKTRNMVPTSIAWGRNPASDVLVAGMSTPYEFRGDPPRDGYLSLWQIRESATSLSADRNWPNIFDITWHPTYPLFATASTIPLKARSSGYYPRGIRSIVRLYEPGDTLTSEVVEYDCPALDINHVSFCPSDSNYICASCTDGVTYVWDSRKHSEILHKLPHGDPLTPLDHEYSREQSDVGVGLAIWSSVDSFYSGSSDGVVKEWNILRNPEDVLVQDVASFDNELMCGEISPDHTCLLIGDTTGGIHVLSKAAFSMSDDSDFEFEENIDNMEMYSGLPSNEIFSGEELSMKTALSCGKLSRHPIYGVGQGPNYDGPWALWARPPGTTEEQCAGTPLLQSVYDKQLVSDGHANLECKDRKRMLDMVLLAQMRNRIPDSNKQKQAPTLSIKQETMLSLDPSRNKSTHTQKNQSITPIEMIGLIDDGDAEENGTGDPIISATSTLSFYGGLQSIKDQDESAINVIDEENEEETLSQRLGEDHWWPEYDFMRADHTNNQ